MVVKETKLSGGAGKPLEDFKTRNVKIRQTYQSKVCSELKNAIYCSFAFPLKAYVQALFVYICLK
jgi:hypothetical protein